MATAHALLARVAKIERARTEAHATASLLEAIEAFAAEGLAVGRMLGLLRAGDSLGWTRGGEVKQRDPR